MLPIAGQEPVAIQTSKASSSFLIQFIELSSLIHERNGRKRERERERERERKRKREIK